MANGIDVGLFLEIFQKYEHLYNIKHRSYKDNNMKEQSWKEIASAMGVEDVEECKKLWRNLRDRYMREKKKPSGSGADEGWIYFKYMGFYEKFCNPRRTITATQRRPASAASCSSTGSASGDNALSPWSSIGTIMSPDRESQADVIEVETENVSPSPDTQENNLQATPKPQGAKRKALMQDLKMAEDLQSTAQKILKQMEGSTTNRAFLEYVLSRLEEMAPEEAREKRKQILLLLES